MPLPKAEAAPGETKPEPDLESAQDLHMTPTHSNQLPANIGIVEDDDDEVGGRPPARSQSKEAEIARQEAAQNTVALKKLPDDESPIFWSRWRKIKNNTILSLATFSVMTPSLQGITQYYGVSLEAAIVSLSLFVLGFGLGPFIAGPTSDVLGRRMVYLVSFAMFSGFSWGVAYAPNYAALVIFRLLAGLSGSSALNNHPASISDYTNAADRNRYSVAYACCAFLGASIGPLVGGFVVQQASWRWNLIVTAILVTVSWGLIIIGVDESYAPILLARKNKHHKRADGGPSFASRYRLALIMPWKLLFTEPIVALTSFYLSILYAIFYAIFPVAPIIYVEVRGWSPESLALSYIAPTLGFIAGGLVIRYGQEYAYNKIAARMPHGQKPSPDARFGIMLWFSWMVPVGIFLIAFCSYKNTHWFGDTLGFFMLTMGTIIVFTGLIPFTIDLYLSQAASALAAQVATRAIAACAFPLFSRQMFHTLGIPGAACLLGGITVLLTPMPFIFKKYGSRLWDR